MKTYSTKFTVDSEIPILKKKAIGRRLCNLAKAAVLKQYPEININLIDESGFKGQFSAQIISASLMKLYGSGTAHINVIDDITLVDPSGNDHITKKFKPIPSISRHLYSLLSQGLKTTGEFGPALSYIEEQLTFREYASIELFFKWLQENDRSIGHGNYQEEYQQFRKESK